MIGSLVERVRRRQQRDQIIMAVLFAVLIFFTLWIGSSEVQSSAFICIILIQQNITLLFCILDQKWS